MKGRKSKINRKRNGGGREPGIYGQASSNIQSSYDLIPDVQDHTVEAILMSAHPRGRGFGHVTVGGERVCLDLANTEEVCSLVSMMENEEEFTLQAKDLIKYYGECLRENRVFVARALDGELVAAAIYGPSAISRGPKQVTVSGFVYVSEKYRGQGVGKDFLQQCLAFAGRYGFKTVLGEVSAQDPRAAHFIHSAGFQVFGGLPQVALASGDAEQEDKKLLVFKMLAENFTMKMSRL